MSVAKRNAPSARERACDAVEVPRIDEASLPVALLRPRVGKEQVDACERRRGQPVEQRHGVVVVEPDIADRLVARWRDGLRHAALERLDADEAVARVFARLRDRRCSPPPKPISSRTASGGHRKEHRKSPGGAGSSEGRFKRRQQAFRAPAPGRAAAACLCAGRRTSTKARRSGRIPPSLRGPPQTYCSDTGRYQQPVAANGPRRIAVQFRGQPQLATRRSSSTRSVRSQEKPPSVSGGAAEMAVGAVRA